MGGQPIRSQTQGESQIQWSGRNIHDIRSTESQGIVPSYTFSISSGACQVVYRSAEPFVLAISAPNKSGLTESNLCNQQIKCLSMKLFTQNTGAAFSFILLKTNSYNSLALTPVITEETTLVHSLIFSGQKLTFKTSKCELSQHHHSQS